MKRSEFVKSIAGSIHKLMVECEEKGSLLDPEDFVNFVLDLIHEKGILNPTHFLMDANDALHQVSGWEPETEVKDEV